MTDGWQDDLRARGLEVREPELGPALARAFSALETRLPDAVLAQQQARNPALAPIAATHILRHADRALRLAAGASDLDAAVAGLVNGATAFEIMRHDLDMSTPKDAACRAGCFFCCVTVARITATETELRAVHRALEGLPRPAFHPDACPSLDPDTGACRAYEVRPLLCRDVYALEADPCRATYDGDVRAAPAYVHRGGVHVFFAVNWALIALERSERLATYDLKKSLRAGGTPIPLQD